MLACFTRGHLSGPQCHHRRSCAALFGIGGGEIVHQWVPREELLHRPAQRTCALAVDDAGAGQARRIGVIEIFLDIDHGLVGALSEQGDLRGDRHRLLHGQRGRVAVRPVVGSARRGGADSGGGGDLPLLFLLLFAQQQQRGGGDADAHRADLDRHRGVPSGVFQQLAGHLQSRDTHLVATAQGSVRDGLDERRLVPGQLILDRGLKIIPDALNLLPGALGLPALRLGAADLGQRVIQLVAGLLDQGAGLVLRPLPGLAAQGL